MENFVDGKQYFDVKAVAEMFKVHPETVKRWVRKDKLEKSRFSGNLGYMFSEDSLSRFASGNKRYLTNKEHYDRTTRLKRTERMDVLMDIMTKLSRMKVKMYYDSAVGGNGITEKYVEGWTHCADDIEKYVRDLITQLG